MRVRITARSEARSRICTREAEIRFDVDTAVGLLSDAVSKESGSLTSAGGGAGNNAEFIFGFICGGGGGKAQSHCSKC